MNMVGSSAPTRDGIFTVEKAAAPECHEVYLLRGREQIGLGWKLDVSEFLDRNAESLHFEVEYSSPTQSKDIVLVSDLDDVNYQSFGEETSFEIEVNRNNFLLFEGVDYTFRVRLVSSIAGLEQEWSWSDEIEIDVSWRPYQPENVDLSIDQGILEISWDEARDGGQAITGRQV